MAKTFNELSNDLKSYLIDMHSNYKGLKNVSVERYNNLKLSMKPELYQVFHLIIRIGISEAVFLLPDVQVYNGGLGMDEKFVIRWLHKDAIVQELNSHWKNAQTGLNS